MEEINFDRLFIVMDTPPNDRRIDKLIREHYELHKFLEGKYFDILISKIKLHNFKTLNKERIDKVITWIEKEKRRALYSLKKPWKEKYWWLISLIIGIAAYIGGIFSPILTDMVKSKIQSKTIENKKDSSSSEPFLRVDSLGN